MKKFQKAAAFPKNRSSLSRKDRICRRWVRSSRSHAHWADDNDALGPVVCRAADRERASSISFSNGATDARKHMEYHPLAQQKAGRHMEPFVIDINPEESPDFQLSAHEGEEFIYVMQGEVEIVYGKEKYTLKEGDSIFYDSIVKHHVHGAPGKSAKILAVVYIPF